MTILIVKNIDAQNRGTIKNYMLEVKPMVFVGNINKKIRDFLIKICENASEEFILIRENKKHLQGIEILQKKFYNIKDICGLYATTL